MSGMFFKPDMPFWTFIQHRYSKVLKPFLFMVLFIYVASMSFSKVSFLVAGRRLIKDMYANGYYLDWVQLWFLPHLFVVSFFAYFFFQVIRRSGVHQLRWVILPVLYIVGVLGIALFYPVEVNLLEREFTVFGLPFSLDLVFVSGFFFILGYELNGKPHVSLFENILTLLISGITLIVLVWYLPPTIDFNTRQFGSLFINTAEALLGIVFFLALSKQMERIGWLSSLFRYVDQASLIILIFQVPIQDYWGQKILALTGNLQFSYWISFLTGVIGPIIISVLFLRPNPIVRGWFNQPAPQENQPRGKPRTISSAASGGVLNPKGNKQERITVLRQTLSRIEKLRDELAVWETELKVLESGEQLADLEADMREQMLKE